MSAQRGPLGTEEGFSHFLSNVPSLLLPEFLRTRYRRRHPAALCLLSIPLGSLPEMEKAIMASVWITTDYNNGGDCGGGGG